MTHFKDGPAKGQRLMLKRSPKYLRVTCDKFGRNWDALDQESDAALPKETLYCYVLADVKGHVHLNFGGGKGGFYPLAEYSFAKDQPDESLMRDNAAWQRWVVLQA